MSDRNSHHHLRHVCSILLGAWAAATAAGCSSGGADATDAGSGDAGEQDSAADLDSGGDSAGFADAQDSADSASTFDAPSSANVADGGADGQAASDGAVLSTVSGHVVAWPASGAFPGPNAPALAGRRVTVLDAAGKKTETVTDASGAFDVSGVIPPYDALVDTPQGATGSNFFQTVFVSIGTLHPRLLGQPEPADGGAPEPDGSGPPTWRQGELDVPLQLPTCPSTNCSYYLELVDHVSGSSLGGGRGSFSNQEAPFTALSIAGWYGDVTDTVDVYVLAFDEACTSYWYGSYTGGVLVQDKATTQLPVTIAPSAVPNIGTFTLEASASAVPPAWGSPTLDVSLSFPGTQASASVAYVQSTSVAIEVPDILGATLGVQASSQDPDQNDPRAWAAAAANALPLTTGTRALAIPGPPVVTSPPYGGAVSLSGGAISWTAPSQAQVYFVELFDLVDGGVIGSVPYVLTGGGSIDLGRLSMLGVALPEGSWSVFVDGMGKVPSLDAILDESTLAVPDGTESDGIQWRCAITP